MESITEMLSNAKIISIVFIVAFVMVHVVPAKGVGKNLLNSDCIIFQRLCNTDLLLTSIIF